MTPDQIRKEVSSFCSYALYADLPEESRANLRTMEITLIAKCYKELLRRVDYTKNGKLVQLMFNGGAVYPPPSEDEQRKEQQEMKEEREKEAIDLKEYRLRDAIFYLQHASERYVAAAWPSAILLNKAKDMLKKEGLTDDQIQVLTTGPNKKLVPYE